MKKTIAAILLIAMIAVAIALPSFASENIYFTSVNNILMPLSDDTMPINHNGIVYVPYSVFNSNELGTFAVYSRSAQIVTVFGGGVQLYFDMQDGTTYDTFGEKFRSFAISTNGLIYLPAAFTCNYFGINYSSIYGNKYGTIIRMTVGDVYDDATFSSAASALMKSRLDDYNKAKATPTPSSVSTPQPTPTPTRTPPPSVPDENDHSNVKVYISFVGIDPDSTPRILTSLQVRSDRAAFFVTADEISAYPELIRRINGSGHMLGIICGENYEEDYASASSLLFDAARTTTFITASDHFASDSGLINYCSPSDAEDLQLPSCLSRLSSAEDRVDFIFSGGSDSADTLASLLRSMKNDNYNIVRLSEAAAAKYAETE